MRAGESVREKLERRRYGDLSPLGFVVLRAFRDHPRWRGERPSWIAVSLWAYNLVDEKPDPGDVGAAVAEVQAAEKARREKERGAA